MRSRDLAPQQFDAGERQVVTGNANEGHVVEWWVIERCMCDGVAQSRNPRVAVRRMVPLVRDHKISTDRGIHTAPPAG